MTITTTPARIHWMIEATSVDTWMSSAMSAVGHEHVHDVDDLQHRLELAVLVGGDGDALRDADDAQHADGDLAADDDHGDPGGDAVLADQRDERRGDEQLVGERVEELPERRDLLVAPRHVAVELVGGRREDEDGGGGDVAVGLRDPREQQHQEHGDEQDPRDGDGVGEVQLAAHGSRLPGDGLDIIPDAAARPRRARAAPRRAAAPRTRVRPSMSGACRAQRPTATPSGRAVPRSMSTSSGARERLPEARPRRRRWPRRAGRRARRRAPPGTWPGSAAAGVPSCASKGNTPAAASPASRTKASSSSNSSSVSPGNPAMKVERTATPGSAARTRASRSRCGGAVAAAPHAPQDGAGGVLQRDVHVGHRVRARGPPEGRRRCRPAAGRGGAARRGAGSSALSSASRRSSPPQPGCAQRDVSWPTSTSSRAPAASAARAARRISAAATVS